MIEGTPERVRTRNPCAGTERELGSKHVDVLKATATAKIVAEESFNHLAALDGIPARPLDKAGINDLAEAKTLKNVYKVKNSTGNCH